MTKRRRISRLQRTRIFDSTSGRCILCQVAIQPPQDKWICEHVIPLWLGGADNETNMGPAHQSCAVEKTRKEATIKARSDRVRAAHLGIRKMPKGRPLPGTRRSGIRIRMNRTVERW